ncbi:short-chain dehydrogenase [Paenibacillus helianthi]|uniref:Short-chain dehydrogenase n=1 Tax=Paenibacillus helianthi TaxID=1349432 RepID=A0ABX3EIB7_9BACL|nr:MULTISPECIES: SDR family NAD(P)-dependent oxidoreductase [Paenibacillus]OKP72211.1 short-chain dehydrogenase [Paenibacillus sp. P3E]OKP80746.1 short-chain dehydrogenase [Paenibacillus helianthi]OKP90308.1 short-chain dehydrogenase [Paenibacillus sp. P32E]
MTTGQQYRGTALITGANNGIGLELTRKMLAEGWQIIALIRSGFPIEDPFFTGAAKSGQLRIYKADLSDFTTLRRALNEIKSKEQRIDLLFNNAGGSFHELSNSKQGREMHFDLQTVAPYLITMELKALLQKGQLKTVVNTSSNAFMTMKRFNPDSLEHPTEFKKLFGPYAASKLALSLWTHELAPQLAAEGILIRSADPGGNNTIRSGKNSGLPFWLKPIIKLFFPHPSHGAGLLYNAALGQHSKQPGVFLMKDRITELKFPDHSAAVLAKVRAIYEQEFLKDGE